MASSREYADYVLEQLSELEEIGIRSMMGEYLLYFRGKIFGAICDDRFLVKPVGAARALMPQAREELPYPGAKAMLLVEELDDKEFLARLVRAMEPELPAKKK